MTELATASSPNPKDSVGALKVDFEVCPQVAHIYWALAMMDGDVKYGIVNWRNRPVKMSVYLSAIKRHLMSLTAGEDLDVDPVSGAVVPHTGRIMACCSIIEDARASGNLIDDRRIGDKAAELLKALTGQSYTADTLKLTRTPGKTFDEDRGGPIDFEAWKTALQAGQKAVAEFKKVRETAVDAPVTVPRMPWDGPQTK